MTETAPDFAKYLNIRTASGPRFSYDGASLAFLSDVTGVAEAWRVNLRADETEPVWPDQLTFSGERVSEVAYAPNDNRLLVCSDIGGSELTQLYILNPSGDELRHIAGTPTTVCNFGAWSPDGQRIVYSSTERDPRFFDVYERDVATGDTRAYALPDGSYMPERYSPDGRSILISRHDTNTQHRLFLLDRETGAARPITSEPGGAHATHTNAAWSADRQGLYLLSDEGQDFTQLAYLDLDSGEMRYLTDAHWPAEALAVSADGVHLALAVNEEGYTRLTVFDVSAGWEQRRELALPDLGPCVLTELTWSADGGRLAFARQSSTAPLDVWALDVASGALIQLTRSATGGVARESLITPTLVHYPTFDGRQIPAFLYTPREQADAARPAIVYVHGGPESQYRPTLNPILQYFVARGYVILAPNVRGSAGYGYTYKSLDDVRLRMDSVADLRHAALWLTSEGIADANRIAVMGRSYGGFMTLAAVTTYPELWAAGVDIVGIANFITFLERTGPWRRKLRESEYGSLERDRDFLTEISPIHKVDRIRAPMFVVHGANDPRVPVSEAEQIVASLRERNAPVEYIRFEDEGHSPIRRANILVAYPAIARFLDRYLGA